MGELLQKARRRGGARAPLPDPALTNSGNCDILTSSPVREVSVCPFSKASKPLLEDSTWLSLIEQLAELSPEDFDSAVLAVRLRRRFDEEGNRREISRVGAGATRDREHHAKRGGPERPKPRTPPAG